jgi:hypothetical protein
MSRTAYSFGRDLPAIVDEGAGESVDPDSVILTVGAN